MGITSLTCSPVRSFIVRVQNIIDHFKNPRNVGSLDKSAVDVGTVSIRALRMRCGPTDTLLHRVVVSPHPPPEFSHTSVCRASSAPPPAAT